MKILMLLLRYINGYVIFTCRNGFPERFANLCFRNKIKIWNIKYTENGLKAHINAADFKRLPSIVRRSGVTLRTEKKIGLKFSMKAHSKRAFMLWGLIGFIIAHFIFNQYIWCIDVQNNECMGENTLLSFAEKDGLYFGKHAKSFDEETAGLNISNGFPDKIVWSCINVNGSMAVIDIREGSKISEERESGAPCNIIADTDGIILSIEAYFGEACVTEGSGVKKGDLLISGIIENEALGNFYYNAQGKITVLHDVEKGSVIPVKMKTQKISEIKNYGKIHFFGLTIPLGFHRLKDNEKLYTHSFIYEINGYRLPIVFEKLFVVSFDESVQDRRKSYIYGSESYCSDCYEDFSNSNLLSSKESLTLMGSSYVFRGTYKTIDNIGIKVPLEIIEEKNF